MKVAIFAAFLLITAVVVFAEGTNETDIPLTEDGNATDVTFTKEWSEAYDAFYDSIEEYRGLLKKGPNLLESQIAYELFKKGLDYIDIETLNYVIDYYWMAKDEPQTMLPVVMDACTSFMRDYNFRFERELSWRLKHSKLRIFAAWKFIRNLKPLKWFNTTVYS